MWKLYKLNFPNGKCYVGITSRTIEERFTQHSFSHYPTGKAIRKYGKQNITIQLLDEGSEFYIKEEEARIVNQLWVDSCSNYNLALGGNMPPGVSMKGSNNPMWKGGVSLSHCLTCGKPTRGKLCMNCYKESRRVNVSYCSVCGGKTSRPEYTVHRSCRKLVKPVCPICNKPVHYGKTVHVKCLKKQAKHKNK